jgi:GT2 family glycosyltransferase
MIRTIQEPGPCESGSAPASANPTVSVVVPAYNCAAFIGRTLETLVAQTCRDIEIVVVDDGSTDDTLTIVRAAAERDARIVVIVQPHSGKAAAARNRGIRAARGELVTFLDADDLCHAERISEQLAAFRRLPELGMVFCDIAKFTDERTILEQIGYLQGLDFLNMAADHLQHIEGNLYACDYRFYNFMSARLTSITTCTVMIRRAVLDQEPYCFNETFHIGEDVDLWFRLAMRCRAGFVSRVLSYYRQRPGSLMSNTEEVMRGVIAAQSANLERGRSRLTAAEAAVIETRLARQYCLYGHDLMIRGNPAAARAAYWQCQRFGARQFPLVSYVKTFVPRPLLELARRARAISGQSG